MSFFFFFFTVFIILLVKTSLLWKLEVFSEVRHTPHCFMGTKWSCRCSQCLWAFSLSFAVLQMCVRGAWTNVVCIHKAHFPSSPRSALLFCLYRTLVYSSSVVKLTFHLHQTPSWVWLVYGLIHLSSPSPEYGPVDTTVQIMPGLYQYWPY